MNENIIADAVSKNLSGYVTPVKDYNYKIIVLNKLNAVMAQLAEIANYNFQPHMVAGGFISVYSLSHLVLPYVSETTNEIVPRIVELLDGLNRKLSELDSFAYPELSKYVQDCNLVVSLLIPLLSYIGISNKQSAVGTFSFPGSNNSIEKPVSDILDEDDDYEDGDVE